MNNVNTSLNFWLLTGASIVTGLTTLLLVNHRKALARDKAIKNFLDTADLLESDLQACREKMKGFANYLANLPGEDVRTVSGALSSDASVTTALKRVLSQRLWLRDQHQSASLTELEQAVANLGRSRASLALHMSKLETMRDELERAAVQLDDAHRVADKFKSAMQSGISHTIH